jgi:hypothetical protein
MSNSCPTELERRLRTVIEDELRRYPHYVGVVSVSDVATDLIPVLVPLFAVPHDCQASGVTIDGYRTT